MSIFVFLVILVGIGAFLGFFELILKHQREMARISGSGSDKADTRIDALQQDVAALKDLMYQQTIVIDRLSSLPRGHEVQERVGG